MFRAIIKQGFTNKKFNTTYRKNQVIAVDQDSTDFNRSLYNLYRMLENGQSVAITIARAEVFNNDSGELIYKGSKIYEVNEN